MVLKIFTSNMLQIRRRHPNFVTSSVDFDYDDPQPASLAHIGMYLS